MTPPLISIALSTSDPARTARQLVDMVPVFKTSPASGSLDGLGGGAETYARWGKGVAPFLSADPAHRMVKARFALAPLTAPAALALLQRVHFELASFRSLFSAWSDGGYDAPCFSDGHFGHGWACAFRGPGHDRLVSRRWLDFGPWLSTRSGDVSLVQFHDLAAGADAALEQARRAHERMGFSDAGGVMPIDHRYRHDLSGVYLAKLASQRIIVTDRDVEQREMLDARVLLRDKRLDPQKPIERVGFVFLDRAAAERHLHELWLRGLECWTYDDTGREVRLDENYRPLPTAPPAWSTAVP